MAENIQIFEGEPNKNYKKMKALTLTIKKMTVFDNPNPEQILKKIQSKAKDMGADAIINLRYNYRYSLINWGYIDVKGTFVKFND